MSVIEKKIGTVWLPKEAMIETELIGEVDQEDVDHWKNSLELAFRQIPDGAKFKMLINLYGFKAINLEVHKSYRDVIPLLLSSYGWKVGYVDLFEEAKGMTFSNTRGIACFAAAHVHQDEEKISKYEARFSRETEHFFTDPHKAKEWLLTVPSPS
jgi:hypothetical protein